MAKKIKKKIEELCGLVGLDLVKRRDRAQNILNSADWKQQLCNELPGLSLKDLEKTLRGILSEREIRDTSELPVKKSIQGKLPPRSLQEILAQVYARKGL